MKSKIYFCLLLIVGGLICTPNSVLAQKNEARTDSIRKALLYQKNNYPASQYRDVYKNFMQDFYGPGHMINDKMVACDNLKQELANTAIYDGPEYEPTGFQGNFYRVNLSLIAYGTIPYETFLNAFVESVQAITPPDPDDWMKTWKEIDKEITRLDWHFENEEKDRQDLDQQFREGNYVVHHSNAYNEAVNFHYRIISKQKFEDIILSYLQNKTNLSWKE